MRFSSKGRYGVRAMIDLALHQKGEPISAKVIAQRQDFSADYLEQIFRLLRQAGLLRSMRGPNGGFLLTRKPSEITIFDILEALNEGITITPCIEKGGEHQDDCQRIDYCAARLIWKKIGSNIRDLLKSTTLEDIIADARTTNEDRPQHTHIFDI